MSERSGRLVISRRFLFEKTREFYPKVSVVSKEFENALKSTICRLFGVEECDTTELKKCANCLNISIKRHWRQSKSTFKTCIANHPQFYSDKIEKHHLFSKTPSSQQPSEPPEPIETSEPHEQYAHESFETSESPKLSIQTDPLELSLISSEPPVKKAFIEKSKSQKNREALKIRQTFEHDAIMHAAIQLFTEQGFNDASFVLKKINNDPGCAKKLRKFMVSKKD